MKPKDGKVIPTIDELKRAVDDARSLLEKANRVLREAQIAACPVAIGDIVRAVEGPYAGKLFRVADIDVRFGSDSPWIVVNPQRLNGSYGIAKWHLFSNWEKVGHP